MICQDIYIKNRTDESLCNLFDTVQQTQSRLDSSDEGLCLCLESCCLLEVKWNGQMLKRQRDKLFFLASYS